VSLDSTPDLCEGWTPAAIGADRRWLDYRTKLRPAGSWAVVGTSFGLAMHSQASATDGFPVPCELFDNKVC
jgi:hypothetical protein